MYSMNKLRRCFYCIQNNYTFPTQFSERSSVFSSLQDVYINHGCQATANLQKIPIRFITLNTPHFTDKPRGGDKLPKYEVKFKQDGVDLKKMFKEFYSLYGPLFLASYIGISLGTLGLSVLLVYSSVDISFVQRLDIIGSLGATGKLLTDSGGKFILAYGLHKMTMPLRIMGAVFLAKRLAPRVKFFKKPSDGTPKDK